MKKAKQRQQQPFNSSRFMNQIQQYFRYIQKLQQNLNSVDNGIKDLDDKYNKLYSVVIQLIDIITNSSNKNPSKMNDWIKEYKERLSKYYFTYVNENLNYSTFDSRTLTSLKILSTLATTSTTKIKIGGLVGVNEGYITNSSVENITLIAPFYVGGFVCDNANKISSSYFKNGNIVNYKGNEVAYSGTAGFVVNNYENATIAYSYVEGGNYIVNKENNAENESDQKYEIIDYVEIDERFNIVNVKTVERKVPLTGFKEPSKLKGYMGYEYALNNKILTTRNFANVVYSNKQVAAFAYNNSGNINNGYSNIVVTGASSSGFVYYNNENAVIDSTYTLSSIVRGDIMHSPFSARTKDNNQSLNKGAITNSYYLKVSVEDYISYSENYNSKIIKELK